MKAPGPVLRGAGAQPGCREAALGGPGLLDCGRERGTSELLATSATWNWRHRSGSGKASEGLARRDLGTLTSSATWTRERLRNSWRVPLRGRERDIGTLGEFRYVGERRTSELLASSATWAREGPRNSWRVPLRGTGGIVAEAATLPMGWPGGISELSRVPLRGRHVQPLGSSCESPPYTPESRPVVVRPDGKVKITRHKTA